MKPLIFLISASILGCLQFNNYAQDRLISIDPIIKKVQFCPEKGLFYTIQIGTYSKQVPDSTFPTEAKPIYSIKDKNGLYTYFSGIYDCRFEATAKRFEIVKSGIYDAHLTAYYNCEMISISNADELIATKGKSILFNSDKNEIAYKPNE
tara:strand:- start:334 stop:783 length:450 start_codon:yes stop_codon:yes gene_type:complete